MKEEYLEPGYRIPNPPPCPWKSREHYLRRVCEVLAASNIPEQEMRICIMKLTNDSTNIRVAMPHGDECPNQRTNPEHEKVIDWVFEWIDPKNQPGVFQGTKSTDCPVCHLQVHLTPRAVLGPAKPGAEPVRRSYLHPLRVTKGHPETKLNDPQFVQYRDYWTSEEIRKAMEEWGQVADSG